MFDIYSIEKSTRRALVTICQSCPDGTAFDFFHVPPEGPEPRFKTSN